MLRDKNYDILKGKRVGLVTNPTGVDSKLKSTIDILFESKEVNLIALYGPEHGVRGNYSAGNMSIITLMMQQSSRFIPFMEKQENQIQRC